MTITKFHSDQQSPEVVFERPWHYKQQADAIFSPARYAWIEASTKSGKTKGCMDWLVEMAILAGSGRPACNRPVLEIKSNNPKFWWVAPVRKTSLIAFDRMRYGLKGIAFKVNKTDLTITFPHNNAVLEFRSADEPDGLYGEDVYAIVADECSRMKEAAWHAIRSTITFTKGAARFIGNVKGRKNWFYKGARRAQAGLDGHSYHKITAVDAVRSGILDGAEIDDAKISLPQNVFKELYLAEASDDGGNPFGLDAIARVVIPALAPGPAVCYGGDLAKYYDWTVIVGLNKDGNECSFHRWQAPWKETIQRISEICGSVPTLLDSTGPGDAPVETLQRDFGRNFQHFKFTAPSKQQLMEGLAVAIQTGKVGIATKLMINELENFEYVYSRTGVKYSAPDGMHDDSVCALGLAVRMFQNKREFFFDIV